MVSGQFKTFENFGLMNEMQSFELPKFVNGLTLKTENDGESLKSNGGSQQFSRNMISNS